MITVWEPLTGRVVSLQDWDARAAYQRLQDAAPVPLTLAVKEHLSGVLVRCQDGPGLPWYCGDCMADIADDTAGQDAHECGRPAPGELAWYTGECPPGYGRLYEVTHASPGAVRLLDMGNVLTVSPRHVVHVERRKAGAAPQ